VCGPFGQFRFSRGDGIAFVVKLCGEGDQPVAFASVFLNGFCEGLQEHRGLGEGVPAFPLLLRRSNRSGQFLFPGRSLLGTPVEEVAPEDFKSNETVVML
jgi:hypothetical protein